MASCGYAYCNSAMRRCTNAAGLSCFAAKAREVFARLNFCTQPLSASLPRVWFSFGHAKIYFAFLIFSICLC